MIDQVPVATAVITPLAASSACTNARYWCIASRRALSDTVRQSKRRNPPAWAIPTAPMKAESAGRAEQPAASNGATGSSDRIDPNEESGVRISGAVRSVAALPQPDSRSARERERERERERALRHDHLV